MPTASGGEEIWTEREGGGNGIYTYICAKLHVRYGEYDLRLWDGSTKQPLYIFKLPLLLKIAPAGTRMETFACDRETMPRYWDVTIALRKQLLPTAILFVAGPGVLSRSSRLRANFRSLTDALCHCCAG